MKDKPAKQTAQQAAKQAVEQAVKHDASVEEYLAVLETQRKLSPHTVENYRRDLGELTGLNAAAGGTELSAITHFQIRKFAAQLHGRGNGAASIARKLSAWRGYFNWLAEHRRIAANPADGVKPPKRVRPLPKALAADDAVRLVAHDDPSRDPDSTMQRCNRAMFELLYSSGLRISELTALDMRHTKNGAYVSLGWIDMESAEVRVTGKGGRERTVPVGAPAIQAIKLWLAVRPATPSDGPPSDECALFLTERGTRMSSRVAQQRLRRHAQMLGIPARVHPHMLRHSFASHVLQSSGDLRAVQEMLGHASVSATQIYTSLDFQRLAQVYDAAHPRAKIRKP